MASSRAVAAAPHKPASRQRRPPAPRSAVARIAGGAAVAGLLACIALVAGEEPSASLVAPGGVATFLGNLTGLAGTYLAMLMVLLASRIPALERVAGLDGLLRWHRRVAPWPLGLITLHALLLTVGFAQTSHSGIAHEIGTLVTSYPDMLAAFVGFGLMLAIGVVSIRALRRRLRRETWWAVHLYMYLAIAMSFPHIVVLGPSFVGHPVTQAVWGAVWAATAGSVIVFRVGLPVVRSLRHRLRVETVRPEAPGVVSVICSGRHLERLAVFGGQFFCWRFLIRGMWWQAHPYSLSALPSNNRLRLTVKAVGDHSQSVGRIRPGTRVVIEGPYGAFTPYAQRRQKAVLIAGGIGVTALRSLLEDLPLRSQPAVILRATSQEDAVFRQELADLVAVRRGQLHELFGNRVEVVLDPKLLLRLVPDLRRRDAYVCGPEGFVAEVVEQLRSAGVASGAIHHEAYVL